MSLKSDQLELGFSISLQVSMLSIMNWAWPNSKYQDEMSLNTQTRSANTYNWSSTSDFGTYRIVEQQVFRQTWATTQSRQSICCLNTQSVVVHKDSNQMLDF